MEPFKKRTQFDPTPALSDPPWAPRRISPTPGGKGRSSSVSDADAAIQPQIVSRGAGHPQGRFGSRGGAAGDIPRCLFSVEDIPRRDRGDLANSHSRERIAGKDTQAKQRQSRSSIFARKSST